MYTIIWNYKINPAFRSEFEELYGQNGGWVQLFKLSDQFIETEFYQCHENDERYITIDKWKSRESYVNFKALHSEEYKNLDSQADDFTNRETMIGSFEPR